MGPQAWDGPPAPRGAAIGLFGGSFDPPHEGHLLATRAAMRAFGLSRAWWLVSPGNPLKARGPAPMAARMDAARALARHPGIAVTDVEARLGTRHTAETLRALRARHPGVRFVWLMGADNLLQFHLWHDWREIAAHHPIGVVARPGLRVAARLSPAARALRRHRLPGARSRLLARSDPPRWCLVNAPMSAASSTAIRAAGRWGHEPLASASSRP